MTTTLNHYPTTDQVRALISQDELDKLVADVSDYHRTTTLATYDGNLTPDLIHAWAYFAQEIISVYPDAEVGRDLKVTRKLTKEELEEVALASQQSQRYYHPENFPLDYMFDDASGKYVPATTEYKENQENQS